MKKKEITIIFPTRCLDKKSFNFIKKFKNNFKNLDINLIIIVKKIKIKIKNYNQKKTKVLIQRKNGFMNACFEAIKYVKSEHFTFIYDDDVFSNNMEKLYEKINRYSFAMSYGKITNSKDINE